MPTVLENLPNRISEDATIDFYQPTKKQRLKTFASLTKIDR